MAGREGRDAGLDFVNRVTTPGGADFVAPAARIAAFDNDGTLRMEQPLPPQFDFVFGTWALEVQHDPSLAEQQPTKHAFGLSLGSYAAEARFSGDADMANRRSQQPADHEPAARTGDVTGARTSAIARTATPTSRGVHDDTTEATTRTTRGTWRRRLVDARVSTPLTSEENDFRSRDSGGWYDPLTTDPRWRDNIPFHEYFDGDTGTGLGAEHQTGWTALVAHLIPTTH